MVIKTFNVSDDAYKQFSKSCKDAGLSMSKQVDMFIKSQISADPAVRKSYIAKLESIRKKEFVPVEGLLMDRYSAKEKNVRDGRSAPFKRESKETKIEGRIALDGEGKYNITTPIGFFTHMLENFTKHAIMNLDLTVDGDMHIDQHHTIEDTGIVLGQAVKKALGSMKGVNRSGFFVYPMDDALSVVAIDIGGRSSVTFKGTFKRRFCGDFDTDLTEEFFNGFARGLGASIAVKIIEGKDDHHKLESVFKGFSKALRMACSQDVSLKEYLPTTKGVFDNL
jgi:imidazoleglycerol-phosphate dehydratase